MIISYLVVYSISHPDFSLRQLYVAYPLLPNPEVMGWKIEGARVELIIMPFPPVFESCNTAVAVTALKLSPSHAPILPHIPFSSQCQSRNVYQPVS